MFCKISKYQRLLFFLVLIYLASRLFKLTLLPVFADEAIYIRWSQLIIDDWRQYLFFPFNDGKTPLQMWLMIPFQLIFADALLAGRLLSVLVGLIQIFVMKKLVNVLGGKKIAQYSAILLTIILPFWFFHHRMALIDALLVLLCSLSLLFNLMAIKAKSKQVAWQMSLASGLFFALAILSKIPALLFIPSLYLAIFTDKKPWQKLTYPSLAVVSGLVIFLAFKLQPAFGQLFARGSDFLYPINEFLTQPLTIIFYNLKNLVDLSNQYLTWPLLLLVILSLKIKQLRKKQLLLILMALSFSAPILVLGKTVYPRYLMYISLPLTLAMSLAIEKIWQTSQASWQKIALAVLLSLSTILSSNFIYQSYFAIENIPFTKADRVQYLEEWSAGFGISESVAYMQALSQEHKLLVATEGFFGTMPDGILMYLHRKNVDNLFVEGIGQPVTAIPESFLKRVKDCDQVILLVNSHRLGLEKDKITLLKEYCRPNGICHQIWDITDLSRLLAREL